MWRASEKKTHVFIQPVFKVTWVNIIKPVGKPQWQVVHSGPHEFPELSGQPFCCLPGYFRKGLSRLFSCYGIFLENVIPVRTRKCIAAQEQNPLSRGRFRVTYLSEPTHHLLPHHITDYFQVPSFSKCKVGEKSLSYLHRTQPVA